MVDILYWKYFVIALILTRRNIHVATINFQLLNLAIWFEIWKVLKVMVYAVFWRFVNQVFPIHDSPIFLDIYLGLQFNYIQYNKKLKHGK